MINTKFENGKAIIGIDSNKDGENVLQVKLAMTEALQELIQKGTKIEGAKVVDFKFELTKLKLKIDTDKDGEELLELELDLGEAFDEISASLIK